MVIELSITKTGVSTLNFRSRVASRFRGYGTFVFTPFGAVVSGSHPTIARNGRALYLEGEAPGHQDEVITYTYSTEEECNKAMEFFITAVDEINRNEDLL